MTFYGMNPSYHTWTGRHILFNDPIRRGRDFEIFTPQGVPTGEKSPVDNVGWPVVDGRSHGLRLFGSMMGAIPSIDSPVQDWIVAFPTASGVAQLKGPGVVKAQVQPVLPDGQVLWRVDPAAVGNGMIVVIWPGGPISIRTDWGKSLYHIPGLQELKSFDPLTLRTLNWEHSNEPAKPRTLTSDPLQGSRRGMALEYQILAANALKAHLWYCIHPRINMSEADYDAYLTEIFTVMEEMCVRPPVLEWDNETWNNQVSAAHNWLKGTWPRWIDGAAHEIEKVWQVADRVFGESSPLSAPKYFSFVGGHLQNPSVLRELLEALSDPPFLAGPAAYVGALREDSDRWEAWGTVPTQDELFASAQNRLAEVAQKLCEHRTICNNHGVRFMAVYEAGQSFEAQSHPWGTAARAAQREEWMGDLYRQLRGTLEANGVTLANWYSLMTDQNPAPPLAPFGLLEAMGVPPLPKALAAMGQ